MRERSTRSRANARFFISSIIALILSLTWSGATIADEVPLFSVTGFAGPEAVRYDPENDVYFVSNFNVSPSGDANGFVSRVSASGAITERQYMVGTEQNPLHGARGMFIEGPDLWVADAGGIHRFRRSDGAQQQFIDFSGFEPGFLNDIVVVDRDVYVTDTGTSRLFKVSDGEVTVEAETPFPANGITMNPETGRLLLVPWEDSNDFVEYDLVSRKFEIIGTSGGGGNFDGVEFFDGAVISASQEDTSLHLMINGEDRRWLSLAGGPADIGIDTQRKRIAVPFVGLDRVDVFELTF